ncbi:unnamed protein product [Sphagnum balticum]
MIYTRLDREVCEQIINELNIGSYIGEDDRICGGGVPKTASEWEEKERADERVLTNLRGMLKKLAEGDYIDRLHENMFELAVKMKIPILNDETEI